jgi:hypothetical protein
MIMPMPRWREDHITPLHLDFLTLNGCEAIGALDDKSECESCMSVCGSCLAWVDELEAAVDGVGCVGCFYSTSVYLPPLRV